MRNRAKCKLCKDVIESLTIMDYISCRCGQIAISGGDQKLFTFAIDFDNFMRVDDVGNEIVVRFKDDVPIHELDTTFDNERKTTRKELMDVLDRAIESMENMPSEAKFQFVTHMDLHSFMVLLRELFLSD